MAEAREKLPPRDTGFGRQDFGSNQRQRQQQSWQDQVNEATTDRASDAPIIDIGRLLCWCGLVVVYTVRFYFYYQR